MPKMPPTHLASKFEVYGMSNITVIRKAYRFAGNSQSSEAVEVDADDMIITQEHLVLCERGGNYIAVFAPGEWISAIKDK